MKSESIPTSRFYWMALAGAVIVGVVLRLPGLTSPLNHDEVYTWVAFASKSYETIATFYPVPNNHILHSMLVRLATQILGPVEWVMRLPALVAGTLAIGVFYMVGRSFFRDERIGLLAAWLLALLPVHVGYSQAARGYSLLVLFSASAVFALWRAMNGSRWLWIGYVISCFLSAYAVPSGALHWVALVVWSAVVLLLRRDWSRLGWAGASNLLVGLLVAAAYWPLRQELVAAGAKWGIAVGEVGVLLGLARELFLLCVGHGFSGWVPGLLAVAGTVFLLWKQREVGLYSVSLWTVPFSIAAITGTAGQPRSYLFISISILLNAAFSAVSVSRSPQLRGIVVAMLVAGYLWTGTEKLTTASTGEGLRAVGRYLKEQRRKGDIVVAPYIKDLIVWHYSTEAIQQGLVSAAVGRQTGRLLFVVDGVDRRFQLDSYLLTSTVTDTKSHVSMPKRSFTELFEADSEQVFALTGSGHPMFPDGLSWTVSAPPGVMADRGRPGLSREPSLTIDNPEGDFYELFSRERFAVSERGLVVLLQARTDQKSNVGVYRDEVVRRGMEMLLTVAKPVKIVGRNNRLWYLEAYILPVSPGQELGIYLQGSASKGTQHFSEITGFFYAYNSEAELSRP